MFEWLFKYPLVVWREASLVFDSGWPLWLLLGLFVAVLLLILASLWGRAISRGRRSLVFILQSAIASILLTILWQPALNIALTERGENTVAWLVDNSASMQLKDVGDLSGSGQGESRFDAAMGVLESVAYAESREFETSLYGIGRHLSNAESVDALREKPSSPKSSITGGMEDLLGSVNDSALAAIVLMTDGADNSNQLTPGWWQALASSGVPVHTVGLGKKEDPNDLELVDVQIPEFVQPDSTVDARIRIRHSSARQVRVRINAGRELLAATNVELPADSTESIHIIKFPSGISGVRQLEVSVEAIEESGLPPDTLPANNRQPRIMQVADAPKRILYIEGEPRWEFKFIRRAVNTNASVELVSLLRTSPNKFYRQGVRSAAELASGFPRTREALFQYDAVIIGSYDAAEISTEQQSLLRDFVRVRGGTLLMLAGRQGLADGGWGRSVTAAALPVILNPRLNTTTFNRARWQVMPTLAGLRTPWLNLDVEGDANLAAWQGLPAIADAQVVGQLKPGSVTLLERIPVDSQSRQSEPLLVMHRYGKGRSLVLGTSGTWRWQMSLPSSDTRHERFWAQLLGSLVQTSASPINVSLVEPVSRDAQSASVSITAYNPDYSPVQAAVFPVTVKTANGQESIVQLYADTEKPGRFVGDIPIDSEGAFSVSASAAVYGESPVSEPVKIERWGVSELGNAEVYNSELNDEFLKRVASVSGGTYLELADIDQLQTVLSQDNAALKRDSRLPLWDMPFFFICLFVLTAIEWMLRLYWKRL